MDYILAWDVLWDISLVKAPMPLWRPQPERSSTLYLHVDHPPHRKRLGQMFSFPVWWTIIMLLLMTCATVVLTTHLRRFIVKKAPEILARLLCNAVRNWWFLFSKAGSHVSSMLVSDTSPTWKLVGCPGTTNGASVDSSIDKKCNKKRDLQL